MKSRLFNFLFIVLFFFNQTAVQAINQDSGFDKGKLPAGSISVDCSAWSKNLSCAQQNQQDVDNVLDQLTSNPGTVTAITAGTGLTGGTITSSGTIALDLTHANNWTGQQIFNAANVGIGSVNPTQALDVNGTVRAGAFTATNANAVSTFSGNVGVGTTTAATPLQVFGTTTLSIPNTFGINLLNPTFVGAASPSTGPNNWTYTNTGGANPGISLSGSTLTLFMGTGAGTQICQSVTAVAGTTYSIGLTVNANSGHSSLNILIGTSCGDNSILSVNTGVGVTGSFSENFTASGTTTWIALGGSENQVNNNVSFTFAVPPTSVVSADFQALNSAGGVSIGGGYTSATVPMNGLLVQSNTGIGSVNPGTLLDVAGTVRASNFTGNGAVPTGSANQVPYYASAGDVLSGASNITSNGTNIGIGTVNPQNPLSIGGRIAIGSAYSTIAAPSNGMIVQGNVGIGSANPGQVLDVNGGIRSTAVGSSIFLGNVGIGSSTPSAGLDLGTATTVLSHRTTGIGWSDHNSTNQACNTTCGSSACVIGLDIGTVGVVNSGFVACTDATADDCLCAGP